MSNGDRPLGESIDAIDAEARLTFAAGIARAIPDHAGTDPLAKAFATIDAEARLTFAIRIAFGYS